MKQGLKIVTIGGGSSYTPELIEGFIKRYATLPIKEIWLVDVEEGREKLEIVAALARRQFKKAGLDVPVHHTVDRREALVGADFVTTQLRVGQLQARALDESIPAKYNVLGQETNGPGGFFKALRTIPVILDIIDDVKTLCPDAWVINFTNPAGIVTEAVHRYTDFHRFIGVCNLPYGMHMDVAKAMEVDINRIRIDMAGLNHMVFGLHAYCDGIDVLDTVLEKMMDPNVDGGMKNVHQIPWSSPFLRTLHAIPCSYLRYYVQKDQMLAYQNEQLAKGHSRAIDVIALEKELFESYRNVELDVKPKELEQRGGAYYSDAACNLIDSIFNNKQDIQVVNTRNHGALLDLDADEVVEISCIITKDGPKPIALGHLPFAVQGLVRNLKNFERLAAKAAITGSYEDAYMAMVMNPLVQSEALAKLMLDELLLAHETHLPQFSAAIAALKENNQIHS